MSAVDILIILARITVTLFVWMMISMITSSYWKWFWNPIDRTYYWTDEEQYWICVGPLVVSISATALWAVWIVL